MNIIRESVDPHNTLPQVELARDPNAQEARGTLVPHHQLVMHDGEQIGVATLVENTGRSKEAYFNGINIEEELRGQGYGLATYLAAIEHAHSKGLDFRTHDWSQTKEAAKVWTKFIELGIAEVIEPFEPIEDSDKFSGHAVIRAT